MGKEGSAADVWAKIGKITGAGEVPRDTNGNASIDITDLAAGKVTQIDNLLERKEEARDEAKAAATEKKTK